jgi:hypothetical protein
MTHFERSLQLGRGSSLLESYSTETPAPVPDLPQVLAISVGGVSQFDVLFVSRTSSFFKRKSCLSFDVCCWAQHTILFALPSFETHLLLIQTHSCAILINQQVKCWGSDNNGQV